MKQKMINHNQGVPDTLHKKTARKNRAVVQVVMIVEKLTVYLSIKKFKE